MAYSFVQPEAATRVMGILNVTPDSFADGGRSFDVEAATWRGRLLIVEGASIVDVGGESTRPGAEPIDAKEQIRRVLPVIERLAPFCAASRVALSIDTTSAPVAKAALLAGASIINDVSAGRDDEGMLPLAAQHGSGLILMHRRVAARADRYSDQYATPPRYDDVVADVGRFLAERVALACAAGIAPDSIAIDPGLGFGKSVADNLALLARLDELRRIHPTILAGASRKSFLGATAGGVPVDQRLAASLAAAIVAAQRGASIVRVHDVAATVQALRTAAAVESGGVPLRA